METRLDEGFKVRGGGLVPLSHGTAGEPAGPHKTLVRLLKKEPKGPDHHTDLIMTIITHDFAYITSTL